MKKLLVLLILVGSLVGLGHWLTGLASQPSIATVGTSTTTAVAPSMPVGVQTAPSVPGAAVSAHSAPRAATAPATTTVRPASTPTTVRSSSTPTTAAPRVTSTTVAPTTSTTVATSSTTTPPPPGGWTCQAKMQNSTVQNGRTGIVLVTSNEPNETTRITVSGTVFNGVDDQSGKETLSFVAHSGDSGIVDVVFHVNYPGEATRAHCMTSYTVT